MKAPKVYSIYTQELAPDNLAPEIVQAEIEALRLNARGFTINSVSGTAIAGTRTSGTEFTRTAGYWIDEVVIHHGGVTAANNYTNFQLGETITETTSGAVGVVQEVADDSVVIKTVTTALFVGDKVLTGGTTGVTATGDGDITTKVMDLCGQLAFSHASGITNNGVWLKIASNTATKIVVDGTLHATGTAVIIAKSEQAARESMDISLNADVATGMFYEELSGNFTIPDTVGSWTTAYVTAATGEMNLTLPDATQIPNNAIIHIVTVDATSNAVKMFSHSAAQTHDGVDISAGFGSLDANGDWITIQKVGSSPKWRTIFNGIA